MPTPSQSPADAGQGHEGLTVLRRVFVENGRDHLRGYLFAGLCLITMALTTAYVAYIMKSLINEAFAFQSASKVNWICLSIFIAFSLRGFASYGQAVSLSRISNRIIAGYQKRVASHLMSLSIDFFNARRSAQIVARVNQNIMGVRDVLNMMITATIRDALTLVSLVAVMVYQDWVLSMIALAAAPPLLMVLSQMRRQLSSANREGVKIGGRVAGSYQETIQGISIVKAFTMENELSRKMEELVASSEERANQIVRLSERNAPVVEAFAGASIALVLAYASYRTIYLNVPPGAFFSFITALLMAYDPARRLVKVQVQMQRASNNARMLYELLDTPPNQPDRAGAMDIRVSTGTVEFRNVDFSYGGDLVLKNVSFTAEGGKTTALVGPSGAGKSTVMNLVMRFFDINGGVIAIDDQDISLVGKKSLREKISYVSQQPFLFEGTVRDNIRFGRPTASDGEVEEAARRAYCEDFIAQLDRGYDTPLGENGLNLSGGQRQRLSIARAILRDAQIILLDEPTSALDTESELIVRKALDEVMAGRTVIVIAHRLSTIAHAHKIIVMNDGRVIEEGTQTELMQNRDGMYSRLHNLNTFAN